MANILRIKFSKSGDMRFISHLDLVRLFQRASRRAALPVFITKGFSPRLKISVLRALKLGVESHDEEARFYMDKEFEPIQFMRKLNEVLPQGVEISSAQKETN